jgi:hypothetical protein
VISSEEVDGASVGEETFRYRARLADPDFGESGDLVIVMTRDANLIASVLWVAESNILVGETVDLTQGLLDAFETALVVSSQPTPTAVSKPTPAPTVVPTMGPTPSPIPTAVPINIGNVTGFVDYVDDRNNFAVSIPSDWMLADIDPEVKAAVAALAEKLGVPSQGPQVVFIANEPVGDASVSVIVEYVPGWASLSEYMDVSIYQLSVAAPDADILETYITPISGRSAGVVVYTRPATFIDPVLSDYTMWSFSAVFLNDDVGWTISCLTVALDIEDSPFVETCEEVVRSFDLGI